MSRSLESLNAEEVLALAVHIERANERRLRCFADVFRGYDDDVAARFDELASEEAEHERILVLRHGELFGHDIRDVDETAIKDVIESFDLPEADALVFDSLEPTGVFELALRSERQARAFYRRAAGSTKEPELRSLFEELMELEGGHVSWLEAKLNEPTKNHDGGDSER